MITLRVRWSLRSIVHKLISAELPRHDLSFIALFAPHMCMVLFFTHIPFVVNHTINVTPPERLQQHPLLFTTNHTDRTFSVWRLNYGRPSHPGHSTILLRSEIPSGMSAKLRTVAASNNRVHMPWSLSAYAGRYVLSFTSWYRQSFHATITLIACSRHIYVWCCSSRTSRSWWITQST